MPLFKNKNQHHTTTAHHDEPLTGTGFAGNPGSGPGHHGGTGVGTGMNHQHHPYGNDGTTTLPGHQVPATGFEQTGYAAQPHSGMGAGNHEYPGGLSGANDPYAAAGVGHGNNMGHHHNNNMGHHNNNDIPPSNVLHTSSANPGERNGGSALGGKVERMAGELLGSRSLQAKGMQKEQEARALKVQSSELAEAERLERDAKMRRERAVAHGAHPDNQHTGAGRVL